MDFDEKLAGMILLLAENRKVTRTELNKLLFFADVVNFLRHDKWISTAKYFKKQYGPVPQNVDQVRSALVAWEYLDETSYCMPPYYQYDYQTREDNVDLAAVRNGFSTFELQTISDVAHHLRRFSASELSNRSHQFEPWRSAVPQAELHMVRVKDDAGLREWLGATGVVLSKDPAPADQF